MRAIWRGQREPFREGGTRRRHRPRPPL